MIKKYAATVIEIDDIVEEFVVLLINNVEVRCFISYCPHRIRIGEQHSVELEIVLPDENYAETSKEKRMGVETIDDSFSCILYGYLNGSILESFVSFYEQEIHYEYPHLNERYVKIIVERINVFFE
ncbi:hypothetical protein [Pseudomonas sp. PSE1(2024)]|uniref:hypothetical protein n=1 Tax=Pseudomonas sp. PSE1(2024) TaxID=3228746 RepID=UPI003D98E550